MTNRWCTLPFAVLAGALLTTAGAAPAVAVSRVGSAGSAAAATAAPPPFTATSADVDAGDGVRARAGTVTVTDPTDGPVAIDTTLYLPATTSPAPAVLLTHGFGGSKDSVRDQALELARAGMVVLAWSAPGFGHSGGTISLMSLDHEIPDARQLVDHLAAQPEVLLDGPGDPRVGVAGGSYGGAASLEVAGTDPRVDAVAAAITWNDLGQALFPDDAVAGAVAGPAPAPAGPTAGTGPLKTGWTSALFASGLGTAGAGAAAGGAAAGGAAAGGAASTGAPAACGRFRLEYCLGYAEAVSTGRLPVQLRALLARSSPAAVLSGVHVPTLLVQGQQDTLFGLDQAQANARALVAAGAPVTVRWYAGGHDSGSTGQSGVEAATVEFLRLDLQHATPAATRPTAAPTAGGTTPFSYDLTGRTDPVTGETPVRTVTTDGYPADDTTGSGGALDRSLAVSGAQQQVVRPPGGQPAALTALTGLGISGLAAGGTGSTTSGGAAASGGSDSTGGGTTGSGAATGLATAALVGGPAAEPTGEVATFPTAPLTAPLTLTGRSRIGLVVTGAGAIAPTGAAAGTGGTTDGPLFARLLDIAPDGTRTLLGPGAAPFTVPGLGAGTTRTVTVSFPGAVTTVDAGHRLAVSIATTDASFAFPTTGAAWRIAPAPGARLTVPSIPARGDVDPARAVSSVPRFPLIGGVVTLALAALAALVLAVRRFRRTGTGTGSGTGTGTGADPGPTPTGAAAPATEEFPLVITDLVKSYADGFRAVDGVSFRAQRGHVLGLLGPNGAGKTTTLRVLMGLLRATSGEVLVFGEPVTPGAHVLSRVGSFVEGPGLLPHLTGRGNLASYWAATGRPEHEAGFEEVLAIAGLGSAVDRRARTYSQGMRQRLAIAQAMLGTPDLLVLDEPTNGLDPPQIAAMRQVVRRYAATGRTVVVSSHLLAEVEQTCDHVVVMARGRVLADAGTAELVGRDGPTLFEVDDGPGAGAALTGLAGVGRVVVTARTEDTGPDVVSADLGPVSRESAVAGLVAAGVGVSGVRSRNRLEDVFLDLVSPAHDAGADDTRQQRDPTPVGASR